MPVTVRKHTVPTAAITDRSSVMVDVKSNRSSISTAASFSVRPDIAIASS